MMDVTNLPTDFSMRRRVQQAVCRPRTIQRTGKTDKLHSVINVADEKPGATAKVTARPALIPGKWVGELFQTIS
jgi:hypothetical protein